MAVSITSQLETATRRYIDPTVRVTVAWKNLFWHRLFKASRTISGGLNFNWPIEHGDGSDVQWISDYTPLDREPSEIITRATIDWVFGNKATVLSKIELAKNRGSKEQVVDILKRKTSYTTRRVAKKLSDAVWIGSGGLMPTGISSGTYAAPGTGGAISTLGKTDTNTYAGLTRNTDDVSDAQYTFDEENWFCNDMTDAAGPIDEGILEQALLDTTDSDRQTDMIVTSKAGFRLVYGIATPLQREPHQDAAKLGFKSINFDGIPVVWDDGVPDLATDRRIYLLDMSGIELNWLKGWKLNREPWHKPQNQHTLVTDTCWGFAFAVTEPVKQHVVHGITGA